MESSERGALGLVRLLAACVILAGLLDDGLYFTQYLMALSSARHHSSAVPSVNVFRIVLDAIPVVIGIVMLIKAKAIAEWLSDLIQ